MFQLSRSPSLHPGVDLSEFQPCIPAYAFEQVLNAIKFFCGTLAAVAKSVCYCGTNGSSIFFYRPIEWKFSSVAKNLVFLAQMQIRVKFFTEEIHNFKSPPSCMRRVPILVPKIFVTAQIAPACPIVCHASRKFLPTSATWKVRFEGSVNSELWTVYVLCQTFLASYNLPLFCSLFSGSMCEWSEFQFSRKYLKIPSFESDPKVPDAESFDKRIFFSFRQSPSGQAKLGVETEL